VVDEQDRELPPGKPGEMVVRPARPFAMTTGYYNFWPETVEAFRNLWFHTGDRVFRDEEGCFYFVDRLTDSIRRKGENISSFEVERVVNTHPAVVESAAIPVSSEVGEDEIKICVVPEPGARLEPEELIAHCEQRLPYFMVPRYVESMQQFPRSAIGKVRKSELRAQGQQGITPETWDRELAGRRLKSE
jgi:carnitine-CoA ligase